MKSIFFFRHGQSVANAGGVSMPHADIPLSPLGERQAHELARVLDIVPSKIIASTFIRAQQTAAPWATRLGQAIEPHPLVHEFDNFDFDVVKGLNGAQREPLREAYWSKSDPHHKTGPNAESFAEFQYRVEQFMPQMNDLPDQTVVFGHGMWIGMLIWKTMGFSAQDDLGMRLFRRFQNGLPMPNCACYMFSQAANGNWTVHAQDQLMRRLIAAV